MKPRIITWSHDGDDEFKWLSDGWYREHMHGTPEADALFSKARHAIQEGDDVTDVIKRLEEAGFEVVQVDAIIAQEYGG